MNTYRTSEVAKIIDIHPNTVRMYEEWALIPKAKRKPNGYRFYTNEDIERLKIIRSLRCANYSLEAILRMLNALEHNPQANIEQVLNTPKEDTGIVSVCDRLIVSLHAVRMTNLKMRICGILMRG